MLATEVIKKKRNGSPLDKTEINFFISGYTTGEIPDYQMASLLMAIFLNGMTEEERVLLTQSMLDSGDRVSFENLLPVDKHSTGGVGDKTSLILAPIVAACGVPVPMMSGRGLGHTGGTLDKLESIPGFNVNLDLKNFKDSVTKLNLSFIGQTDSICPADKKIYALRDVTSTVESLPLICASIMSKKIAEGIKGLVLDVKFGSGAFMKSIDDAKALAMGLISIGQGNGIETRALLTNMSQPLGRFVGNAVEVGECLAILKREDFFGHSYKSFEDTEELSLNLAAHMVAIGKKVSFEGALSECKNVLNSGAAFACFDRVCQHQGGDLSKISFPDQVTPIHAKENGFLAGIDAEQVGLAGIELGAGRKIFTDSVDPLPGIEVCKKIGDPIANGELLFIIHHGNKPKGIDRAKDFLEACALLSPVAPQKTDLIAEVIQ